MVNVAILNAVKESKTSIQFSLLNMILDRQKANANDFEHAMDRITMGIGRKKMYVSDKDKLITAYHEGGHALISLLTEGATPLHKVTILSRGGALGFVIGLILWSNILIDCHDPGQRSVKYDQKKHPSND